MQCLYQVLPPAVVLLLLATPRLADASTLPTPVAGSWRVVKQVASGISTSKKTKVDAKTASADGWVGTKVIYSENSVEFGAHRCPKPQFDVDRVDAAGYLGDGFHVAPRRLGIRDKQVDVVTVTCAGKDWLAPGSLLIVNGERQLFAVWDGVFLEMQRQK